MSRCWTRQGRSWAPGPATRPRTSCGTYGHIVVDEAQDLSPMQLRMLKRRSLNGSMTLVGDIAQATGAWAHDDWASVLQDLPDRKEPRFAELTVGYRLPQPTMDVAARVLRAADLGLEPPTAVRRDGFPPRFVSVDVPARLGATVTALIEPELEAIGPGNLAIIAPDGLVDQLSDTLHRGRRGPRSDLRGGPRRSGDHRARRPGQGPGARCRHRRGAGPDHQGRAQRPAVAVRRPDQGHPSPRHRARGAAADDALLEPMAIGAG